MIVCFLLIAQSPLSSIATSSGIIQGAFSADKDSPSLHLMSSFNALPDVDIYNYTGKSNVDLQKARQEIISQVISLQSVVTEEMNYARSEEGVNPDGLPVTLEAIAIGDDITYIYTVTDGEGAEVYLTESNIQPAPETKSNKLSLCEHSNDHLGSGGGTSITSVPGTCTGPCSITGDIPGGLGVRLPMTKSGVKLSFSVVTSGSTTIPPKNSSGSIIGANYLYGGFEGTKAAGGSIISDMGLIHQTLAGSSQYAWKPFYRVNHNGTDYMSPTYKDQNGNNGQVWGSNGYLLGSTVAVEVRIDPVSSSVSKVVLRTEGTAYHATSSGTGGQTYLIQVAYYDNFPKINNPSSWRVLAHPAYNNGMGYSDSSIKYAFVSGDFKNLRVDGALPTFGQTLRDYGYAVDNGNGNYFLQSCKGTGY